MNARFWNLFGGDYRRNCLAWEHSANNPVIPAGGAPWKSHWTANPDILRYRGRTLLYYRGNGVLPNTDGERHDRIAVAEILEADAESVRIQDLNEGRPIVDAGGKGAFDEHHALDPAAALFEGRVFLYYSAVGGGPDSVGLAVSRDGERFEKHGKILEGRAPDVVAHDGKIHMLFQKHIGKGCHVFLAESDDGFEFRQVQETPVFSPEERSWDAFSITTARLSADAGWFYMMYGGSAYLADEPDCFGLARSKDLVHWERHAGNPIFGRGPAGSPDGGAIWFPALLETEDCFILLYEGSRGKYSWDLSSAVCMASAAKGP